MNLRENAKDGKMAYRREGSKWEQLPLPFTTPIVEVDMLKGIRICGKGAGDLEVYPIIWGKAGSSIKLPHLKTKGKDLSNLIAAVLTSLQGLSG